MLLFMSAGAPKLWASAGSGRRSASALTVVWLLVAPAGVVAAPVTGLEEQSEAVLPAKASTPSVTQPGTVTGRGAGGSDLNATAVPSTGDKTLDFLLQQPGQPSAGAVDGSATAGEAARQAAEARAARERLRLLGRSPAEAAGGRPAAAGEANNRPELPPERDWIPPPSGPGSNGALTSGGSGSGAESESNPRTNLYSDGGGGADVGGGFWRLVPPDIRAFVRDNRHLLAAVAVLVALGAGMLKLVFGRR